MINPGHLDLFRAVLRHGGMTKAAAALGIGQPHISRSIALLESEIGFALFVRGHGSAVPTREGAVFAREVERSYAGLDRLSDAARGIRELGVGQLVLACQPSLAARLVPCAIRRFAQGSPGAAVALHVPSPDTIWSWAASGQCDLGLVRPRDGCRGAESALFLTMEAVCAVPRGHALAKQRTISLRDLANEPLVAGPPGALQEAIEAAFAQAGLAARVAVTAQYTAARCGLVAEGLGMAIVDPLPARQLAGLPIALRPFRPRLTIETSLVWPAGRPPSGMVARFVECLEAERDALLR